MPKIVYVGKKSPHYGKTLWEIVGNLKDYGVGRLIARSQYLRYPEPSFDKIVHIETIDAQEALIKAPYRRVVAWVERVFRGHRRPQLVELLTVSFKPDFLLIPKDEEEAWYKRLAECKPTEKIFDPYIPLPPLLNLILKEEKKARGEPVEDVIKVPACIKYGDSNLSRLAKEGETPTHRFSMDFSEPVSPSLFENIEVCRPFFENRDTWKDEHALFLKAVEKKKKS